MADTVEVLVEGGKATPGQPLGPALGPLGVNIPKIVAEINNKTKAFNGMKVPVKIIIDSKTKDFEIKVGTPPTTSLITKELGIEKGSGSSKSVKVGNLTMDQVVKIAQMKADSLMGKDLKKQVLEIIGTCTSMGVTIEGKEPKAIRADILAGNYDQHFA
ncbi:MAG TPA: 50S ribosomal protein L11 [Methanomassiliicoccaceae archaeon]|jgi:large subunit ribosomal protein L11|nr:50S ribosomal protein L11 [Methanomassiliicoccaceae archaeon]HOK27676.1 50S ribosomal protein L11 [Methanomassiliicoccaceae archaeon]HOQ25977.1 50S ribosomal protein L11 [Methanomassiliicoccaceae archaeon]HQA20732.1 50S ribosomal protein L11 [Methanomassiliicoccaceae archaeon]HQD88109.1 50S ribosomal protein L11 [Methanomassiliicoccaceae archaeon]